MSAAHELQTHNTGRPRTLDPAPVLLPETQLNRQQDFYNKYNTTAVKNLDVHIDAGLLFDL